MGRQCRPRRLLLLRRLPCCLFTFRSGLFGCCLIVGRLCLQTGNLGLGGVDVITPLLTLVYLRFILRLGSLAFGNLGGDVVARSEKRTAVEDCFLLTLNQLLFFFSFHNAL